MRTTNKAAGKKKPVSKNLLSPVEERFSAIAKAYGTDDPELIKQKIMWGYIHLLVKTSVSEGLRPKIDHHADQFEACNRFIEHQCVKMELAKA